MFNDRKKTILDNLEKSWILVFEDDLHFVLNLRQLVWFLLSRLSHQSIIGEPGRRTSAARGGGGRTCHPLPPPYGPVFLCWCDVKPILITRRVAVNSRIITASRNKALAAKGWSWLCQKVGSSSIEVHTLSIQSVLSPVLRQVLCTSRE